jgi:hypothetical protein
MNFKNLSTVGFKSLLSQLTENQHREITAFLSNQELEDLKSAPQVPLDLLLDDTIDQFIDLIHPSWIHFLHQKAHFKDQLLICSAFPTQRDSLKTLFNIEIHEIELSVLAKKFIRELSYSHLLELKEKIFPIYSIKNDPMFSLLFLHRSLLEDVIIGLGLFDLKDEILSLIDKEKIQTIKTNLDEKFLRFLKELVTEPKDLLLQPMGLNYWKGDFIELKHLLFNRGLNRFAKIISHLSTTFYWHFSLILSIDEAKIVKKLMVKSIDPKIFSHLKQQLEKAIKFFSQQDED